jgi:hypothetical protein
MIGARHEGGLDLIQLVRAQVLHEVQALSKAFTDGVVDSVEGNRCLVRLGGPSSPALPGWVIPPSLGVLAGDHVLLYRQGGWQLVLEVLNRNALNADQDGGGAGGGGELTNLDGGAPDTVYGGTTAVDGGAP